MMKPALLLGAALAVALSTVPAASRSVHHRHVPAYRDDDALPDGPGLSQYSNGYGTNAANSHPVTPITPYGGYVINEYGFGNYVSGPAGYGGYPAGSPGAIIWQQREQWKCQNYPESC